MDFSKEDPQIAHDWEVAEAALEAARSLPSGEKRIEALRRAGQLRYDVDKRRQLAKQSF